MVLDDYIMLLAAAVTVAFAILSFFLLTRYRNLAMGVNVQGDASKTLWDAVESRMRRQDERIVDIMAKVDVLNARLLTSQSVSEVKREPIERRAIGSQPGAVAAREAFVQREGRVSVASFVPGDLDRQILGLLASGPRTSREIRDSVGRSREHVARVMKNLFTSGYVIRNDSNRPFVYEINEAGRRYLGMDSVGK